MRLYARLGYWSTGLPIVGNAGSAYVAGRTTSNESTFPASIGPDLTHNGDDDVFVAKVNASGLTLDYCGYIGGSDGDGGLGSLLAVDNAGNAYVFGDTDGEEDRFPVAIGPDLIFNGGDFDTFVAKINPSGTALIYCGYIGGGHDDITEDGGIAVDESVNVYVVGSTDSKEGSFPVAVGPGLGFNDGDSDAFVAKIAMEQGFSLEHERPVIVIKRGKTTTLEIHISRDPGFTDSITVKLQNADEKGIKLTPEERVSTTDGGDIKFKLKIKSGAERGTRRLFFTGRTASGIEHTSAVTINITK